MPEPSLPSTVGRYRLDTVIGRGAMGVVYKGFDPLIARVVAIKVVLADLLSGEDKANFLAFFRREAQAAGRCMHPNIVATYDFSDDPDQPFIAMEYVEGETLHRLLRECGHVPAAEAAGFVLQILDALDYAHELDIVHRDIKPANVILQQGSRVKIMDFGVARLDKSAVTQANAVIGTPAYMAPEQLNGGAIDRRTDLFATGILLYEIVTGTKPFSGRDAAEVMAAILTREPAPPLVEGVPLAPALAGVLRRALAKDPQARFQTAGQFAAALRAALAGDTAADDAERTVIAAPRSGSNAEATSPGAVATGIASTSRTATAAPGWKAETLQAVESQLAKSLGPMARVLVKQAAQSCDDLAALYDQLGRRIPGDTERSVFLKHRLTLAGDGRDGAAAPTAVITDPSGIRGSGDMTGPAATAAQIAVAEQALTLYLGPIARVLIKQTLAKTNSFQEFLSLLANHIPREEDRVAFRRKVQ
jgi:serine/threonine-protein kinase